MSLLERIRKSWHELAGQAVHLDDLTKPKLGDGEAEDPVCCE